MMETPPLRPAKNALGRGLGNLLAPEAVRPAPAPSTSSPGNTLPRVTPGVGALLRGAKSDSSDLLPGLADESTSAGATTRATPPARATPAGNAPKVALMVGDAVLLVLVAVLLLRGESSPSFWEMVLGAVAVTVAAWLGCLAVRSPNRQG